MGIIHSSQLSGGTFLDVMSAIFDNGLVRTVVALLVIWFVSGLAVAIKNRAFVLGEIGAWLEPVASYIVGAGLLQLMGMFVPEQYSGVGDVIAYGAWTTLILTLVGKILGNIRELGVNINTGAVSGPAKVIPLWATDMPHPRDVSPRATVQWRRAA